MSPCTLRKEQLHNRDSTPRFKTKVLEGLFEEKRLDTSKEQVEPLKKLSHFNLKLDELQKELFSEVLIVLSSNQTNKTSVSEKFRKHVDMKMLKSEAETILKDLDCSMEI